MIIDRGRRHCELQFAYSEYGKPSVSDEQNDHALNFNISHSGAIALYAVTIGRVVGIDTAILGLDESVRYRER